MTSDLHEARWTEAGRWTEALRGGAELRSKPRSAVLVPTTNREMAFIEAVLRLHATIPEWGEGRPIISDVQERRARDLADRIDAALRGRGL
jgi:hypothetical protein